MCKQILIGAKLKPGKKGVKNRVDWKKFNEQVKVLIGLKCRLRVK